MKHLEAKQGFICNLAIGFFFLLILLSIQFHEMWRDELHTWAVALSSMSIEDIFRIRGSDGHPGLWYIVAYFLSRMTRHPLVFQLFHVAIATGSAAIFLKHAPFTVWKRLMFAFGYYSVFEYALITRAYGLGIALAFLSAAVMLSPRPRALLVGVALFFATQASAYSAILAGAIAPLMLVEFFRSLRKKETERYGWAIGLALVTVGIGLAAWQVLPPAGALASSLAARFTVSTAIQALSDFFSAFYPLPPFERAFWNQNVLASPGLKAILGGLVLLLTMALLARTPIVLSLSYVPGLVAMTAVNAYYEGYLRHHGHFFILFVCCLWLAEKYPKWHSGPWLLTEAWRLGDLLLYSALAIQMAAGFFALQQDWRLPFSGAEETAAVVHARGWDQGRLHGDIDFASSAVATYLDHDFHYPRTNATGKFVNWETRRLRPLAQPEMMVEMIADAESTGVPATAILNYPLPTTSPQVDHVYTSAPAIVADEQFYVYRIAATPRQPTGPPYRLTKAGLAAPGRPLIALESRLSGWVDIDTEIRGHIRFAGWAIDPRSITPATKVVVLVDGQGFYEFHPVLDRPDVARFFNVPRLRAGFDILLKVPSRPDHKRSRIQFYAISTEGVAAELRYHQGYSRNGR